MTIKELLGMTVEQLEAMTDAELDAHTLPYRQVQTAAVVVEEEDDDDDGIVDLEAQKERKAKRAAGVKRSKEEWQKEMLRLAAQQGIDMNTILPGGLKPKQ